jgi:hypothetical protein
MPPTSVKLPPTRNHRQLAAWINTNKLVDDQGRLVAARAERVRTSTDSRVAGTRFRRIGKGRVGLVLEIWPADALEVVIPPGDKPAKLMAHTDERLYRHEAGETYRRHDEARAWVEQHLRRMKAPR